MMIWHSIHLYNPYSNRQASAAATASSITCEKLQPSLFKFAVGVQAGRRMVNVWADQSSVDHMWTYIPPLVVSPLFENQMIGINTALVVTQMTAIRIREVRKICWDALVVAH